VVILHDVLYRHHPGAELYKHAKELMADIPQGQDCELSIHFDAATDRRCYNKPETSEISIMIPDESFQAKKSQDIVIHLRDGPTKHISDCHPFYPALRYVVLFPKGQLGWHSNIPYQEVENVNQLDDGDDDSDINERKQKHVSMAQFYKYQLHICADGSNHLFLAGSLFQKYVCEAWAMAEQNRLNYIKANQKDLRVDLYKGLEDAVTRADTVSLDQLGQRFILPSSFTGSTRNMQQHLQDALAINRFYRGGDLFITMTANSYWDEIKKALIKHQSPLDRHDLVVRVFFAKLKALIKDIKNSALGAWAAHIYTIEFQKRGLPHAHIIVFLKPEAKLCTPEQIDSLMSSEFPENNPALLELIKKYMVHRPCGTQNPNVSCMVNRTCSKSFPKPFREETSVSEDSYASTRRSNTRTTYDVDGKQVDNQWVVCYLPYLIWKYRCHINVESISIASVKAVKYIYKYVYKGHDRATMQFGRCIDEVKLYLDARYISSCEATWRLFHFYMQKQVPHVIRLQVHLPQEQSVVFDP